jgi:hypothetical protein
VIERIFGCMKKRYKILVIAPEYSIHAQARLICALAVIHKFIRIFDLEDLPAPPEDDALDEGNEGELRVFQKKRRHLHQSGGTGLPPRCGMCTSRGGELAGLVENRIAFTSCVVTRKQYLQTDSERPTDEEQQTG